MLNNLSADFFKLKKTLFFPLHGVLPLLGIFLLLGYQVLAQKDGTVLMVYFCQLMSLVYPIVAAWLTNIVIGQEIEAGGGFFLLNAVSRKQALLSKFVYFIIGGLLACMFAIFSYHMLNSFLVTKYQVSFLQVSQLYCIVFGCSLFHYFFHSYLCLKFNDHVSFGVAAIEFLFSGLMMTSLGEFIWIAFPSVWGMRLIRSVGNNYVNDALVKSLSFPVIILLQFIMTLVMGGVLVVSMSRWEGRTNEE